MSGLPGGLKAALFDFDGTLMDSMPAWAGKMLHLLESHGVPCPPGLIRSITPLGDAGAAEYFRRELGFSLPRAQYLRELDDYALPRYRDTILPKAGAAQLLCALRAEGLRLAVLTASPQRMIRPCLARNGLAGAFDRVWSCDDFGLVKSDPAIYLSASAGLGCRPQEAAFFDDNLLAVRTAKAAGLYTVAVYDATSAGDEPALRAAADRYIFSFDELL